MADVRKIVAAVLDAETSNFVELVRIAGLDPRKDFKFMNLNGADFSNCDLREFDFEGSKALGADFSGTLIAPEVKDQLLSLGFEERQRQLNSQGLTKEVSGSLLLKACAAGDLDEVIYQVSSGISPNYAEPKLLMNGIVLASRGGHYETVLWLLKNGASPDLPTKAGAAAQICAAKNGHLDVLRLLHKYGASEHYQNPETGWTALMEACEYGQQDVASYLAHDPQIAGVTNANGDNAVHVAALHGQSQVMGEFFLELLLPAEIPALAAKNAAEETPLAIASREGHLPVVEKILDLFEFSKEVATEQLGHALLLAATEGHFEVVQTLLRYDAKPNETTSKAGVTPLLMAALNGHDDVVEKLIRSGADVNQIASSDGFFPLLAACQNGHAETVRILLEAGADPLQSHGEEKQTSLEMAMYRGHEQIAEILREAIGEG